MSVWQVTGIVCSKSLLAFFFEKSGVFQMKKYDLEQKVLFLKEVAPFKNLSNEFLKQIAASFRLRKFKNRETIIHQGDSTCDFCVIVSGKVRILTINEAGSESCLRVLTARDVLGELSACDNAPRSASAQAIGLCMVLVMRHEDFVDYLKNISSLSFAFIQFLSEKLRWTTHFSHTLAQYDIPGRLLYLIVYYKGVFGREIVPGKVYEMDISLNQTELASMVGARREWINRLLRGWSKDGFLAYSRGIITIYDLPELLAEKDRRMAIFQDETW